MAIGIRIVEFQLCIMENQVMRLYSRPNGADDIAKCQHSTQGGLVFLIYGDDQRLGTGHKRWPVENRQKNKESNLKVARLDEVGVIKNQHRSLECFWTIFALFSSCCGTSDRKDTEDQPKAISE